MNGPSGIHWSQVGSLTFGDMSPYAGSAAWIALGTRSGMIASFMQTMREHIDVDVTGLLRHEMTLEQAGDLVVETATRTANGRLTAAEALGHREFVLTKLYRSA